MTERSVTSESEHAAPSNEVREGPGTRVVS